MDRHELVNGQTHMLGDGLKREDEETNGDRGMKKIVGNKDKERKRREREKKNMRIEGKEE